MTPSEEVTSRFGSAPWVPVALGALAFAFLFLVPTQTLVRDWWSDPDAGHGLLLGPLAFFLMYRTGLSEDRQGQPGLGLAILIGAVALRILSGLAAELFTMRISLFAALAALVIFAWGHRQLVRWWLPSTLLVLSIPIPSVVLGTMALPLQLQASEMGAALLVWRDIPVVLNGNVIEMPGHSLFVTEACSGLRSLTALISLGVLMGGLWLKKPATRGLLLLITIPVAMMINGWRVFLTGFLVAFVDPAMGEGFMHLTEGWVLFVVAFAILSGLTWIMARSEARVLRWLSSDPPPPPLKEAHA